MTITAGDIVNGAAKLLTQLAAGETLSGDDAADGLFMLNQMIDSLNTERLMVYQILEEPFVIPAGTTSKTIGPTGDFVTTRPLKVNESTFLRDTSITPAVDYPVAIINNAQFDSIAVKTVTSSWAQVLYYDPQMPNGVINLWPQSTKAMTLYVNSAKQLTSYAVLGTALSLPPGYQRLMMYNLAVEWAPQFGMEASPSIQKIAMQSKRNVKRLNGPDDILGFPADVVQRQGRFNIYMGQ